jgi:hypothetical protein
MPTTQVSTLAALTDGVRQILVGQQEMKEEVRIGFQDVTAGIQTLLDALSTGFIGVRAGITQTL